MKRRGQGNIIALVLIVAITIVAVILVYNIVKPLVSEKAGGIEAGFERLQLMQALTVVKWADNGDGTLNVTVSRDSTPGDFSGIKYTITTNETTCYVEKAGSLAPLETKTFTISLGDCPGTIEDISAEPTFEPAFGGEVLEGEVLKSIKDISSCQDLYDENTIYYLTEDLSGGEVKANCIRIRAKGAELDCQGHLINNTARGNVILVYEENITVKNCKITSKTDWHQGGIFLRKSARRAHIFNNTIDNDGYAGIFIEVHEISEASWPWSRQKEDTRMIIENNTILKLGGGGIVQQTEGAGWNCYPPLTYNIIRGNTITGAGPWGIYIAGSFNTIERNIINHNSHYGIMTFGRNNTIKRNTIENAGRHGIEILAGGAGGTQCVRVREMWKFKGNKIIENRVCYSGYSVDIFVKVNGQVSEFRDNQCNKTINTGACAWSCDILIRKITNNHDGTYNVTLKISTGFIEDNEIMIIAEQVPDGNISVENNSWNIEPTYNFVDNTLVWIFAKNPPQTLGSEIINETIPSIITYKISGISSGQIRGKYGLNIAGSEGLIGGDNTLS